MRKWVLPEYVDDILPAEAERIESLRRRLLDHFREHRYRLVQPPLIEHLESLLTGTGHDLELQTFKLVDPLSGRLLGVRADITPQVARIDAHLLNEPGVTRLCYAGSVLRTLARGVAQSREVLQIGAELYGDADIGADKEVLGLLLSSLEAVDVRGLHLDLGHVGVYRALANGARIAGNDSDTELFTALRIKDSAAVAELTGRLPAAWRDAFRILPTLYGPAGEVLAAARTRLPDTPSIASALAALETLAEAVRDRVEALHIDLADLRGYHYQNGASFSVFTGGEPNAIGRGERYDGIGKAFGRARPATGFTLDLRQLARLG
ncbi:MAG TPA: ATP phosphoribosyltransferase regulatory subunit [Casimicrobiaceae bacterium]|nr:ATP phosphoribosyltransferase regulatory subunit [Casimicrobiaceae bacterium]